MIRRRELLAGAGALLAEPALAHVRGIGRLRAGAISRAPAVIPFTWNPADAGTNAVLANGNRDFQDPTAGSFNAVRSSASKGSGKWYVEVTLVSTVSSAPAVTIGIGDSSMDLNNFVGGTANSAAIYLASITFAAVAGSITAGTYPASNTAISGDVYMMAFDFGTGNGWVGKNGAWFNGDPVAETTPWITSISAGSWFVAVALTPTSSAVVRLAASTAYAAPTGYSVLNA